MVVRREEVARQVEEKSKQLATLKAKILKLRKGEYRRDGADENTRSMV